MVYSWFILFSSWRRDRAKLSNPNPNFNPNFNPKLLLSHAADLH